MIRVEIDTKIHRPAQVVFDRLVDIPAYNDWMPKKGLFRGSEQTSSGAVGLGTTFRDSVRHGNARGEVVGFDPPRHVAFRQTVRILGIPVLESRPEYTLEPMDGETIVHHLAKGEPLGPWKLLKSLFSRVAQAERKRTVMALKKSFE